MLGNVSTCCLFASPLNPWGWSLRRKDVGNRIIILGDYLEFFPFIAGAVRGGDGYTIINISILTKWGIWTGCQIIGIIEATRQSHSRGRQGGNMEFTPLGFKASTIICKVPPFNDVARHTRTRASYGYVVHQIGVVPQFTISHCTEPSGNLIPITNRTHYIHPLGVIMGNRGNVGTAGNISNSYLCSGDVYRYFISVCSIVHFQGESTLVQSEIPA